MTGPASDKTDKCPRCGERLPSDDSDRTPVTFTRDGETIHEACGPRKEEAP